MTSRYKIIIYFLFALAMICSGNNGFAASSLLQDPPVPIPPPPGLPIDGGVLITVFAGVIYGVVKLVKKK
ncbi:PID-CTERM protein-sorting domain-containing protein [Mangrovimonas aestuarii]|uniref:PID-CTERM protein-sorting domain-containing protein n=1 Tax=Mangrovimonas aestuarii TaxID=3018443 RepID=UPI0023788C2D|nr:hypothetical protein [Mangrovimonas aestuarii]